MEEWFVQILKDWPQIAIAGGLAYGAFKLFGQKSLDSHFEKQLEEFKHQKNTEISKLKIQIDSLLSNKIRNQNKEFDVLESLWPKIGNLYSSVYDVSMGSLPFSDYSKLKGQYLSSALKSLDISEIYINRIVSGKNPENDFNEAVYRKNMDLYYGSSKTLTRSFSEVGIFISEDIASAIRNFVITCDKFTKSKNPKNTSESVGGNPLSTKDITAEFVELQNKFRSLIISHQTWQ